MHQPQPHRHTQFRRSLLASALVMFVLLGGLIAVYIPIRRSAAQASLTPAAHLPLIVKDGPAVSPTASTTPTRTATGSPTATTTAIATSSPTASTTATVTQAAPCNSVYPIAINASLLDAHGFVPPTNAAELPYYGLYSDGIYTNKTQRRLFQPFPGDYLWLAWQPGGNLATLSAALTGTGTLYQGFDEVVPWPDPNTSAPVGYPLYPQQLTPGDWVLVLQSSGSDSRVQAALDNHIIHRTVMTLPIYDRLVSNGAAASVHFARLGNFLLRGYNLGGQTFLDLVYLDDTTLPNCTTAATATPIGSGTVSPIFATVTATPSPTVTPSTTIADVQDGKRSQPGR